jgi:hypothetical protein
MPCIPLPLKSRFEDEVKVRFQSVCEWSCKTVKHGIYSVRVVNDPVLRRWVAKATSYQ